MSAQNARTSLLVKRKLEQRSGSESEMKLIVSAQVNLWLILRL